MLKQLALVLALCTSAAALAAAPLEANTDRPGSDMKGLDLAEPKPELCQAACDGEPACKAFTYVKPGLHGPKPKCYLKSIVPAATASNCCVSGVKPTPIPAGLEANTDRPGSDLRGLTLAQPKPELCRDACDAEPACKAFTYVRPGLQGPSAKCFFKSVVPAAKPSDCCVSGVKQPVPAGLEANMDRPGSDLRGIDLAEPNPELCRDACAAESACKAFTYVKSGHHGLGAKCYLKSAVPAAVPNTACVSGVKPAPPPPPPPPAKGPNYYWDESQNPAGPNRCENNFQCDGMRTCSSAFWCQGTAR